MDNGYDAWAPDNNENYTYSDEPGKMLKRQKHLFQTKIKFKKFNTLLKLSSSSTDLTRTVTW